MSNMIYKKMSDVMKDVGAIGKDQKNTQQGFKFRGIDQFVNALYPALTKHGVFMSPRATSFTHELKDVVRGSALKYALIQTFSIPTEDMAEADFESPEIGTTKTVTATSNTTTGTTVNVQPSPTPVVEPLKKSSFRKVKPPVTSANAPETIGAEEWS